MVRSWIVPSLSTFVVLASLPFILSHVSMNQNSATKDISYTDHQPLKFISNKNTTSIPSSLPNLNNKTTNILCIKFTLTFPTLFLPFQSFINTITTKTMMTLNQHYISVVHLTLWAQ